MNVTTPVEAPTAGNWDAHHPYGAAVLDALARAGLRVTFYEHGPPGEARDMYFELAETLDGDEFVVGWGENEGWSWVCWGRPRGGEPIDHGWFDLPDLPAPDALAAAVWKRLRLPPVEFPPVWTPPPGYDPDTPSPYEADAEAFESTLAAYLTHPAWQAMQEA
ncbi:DUF6292 family protein [Nocardia abscessus]|uniref:DUF6292 family protein n=1 Tax=Nocardia abscessus TaxID=120957 RepID=UPI0024564FC7|nr:DUF6292 family protein [Nocardia abscessus]